MFLTVTTVEREILNRDDITKVTIPTADGEITVLPGHVALMSALGMGEVIAYPKEGESISLFVDGGVLQVSNDRVELLANMAEHADEIDEAKIEEAKRRAEKLLEEKPVDIDLAAVTASLKRDAARLRLKRKQRGRTGQAMN